jgi:hypothetical protein
MRKDQLEDVAINSGASRYTTKLKSPSKKELLASLVHYFERTAHSEASGDEQDKKGHTWLPEIMAFPASPPPRA